MVALNALFSVFPEIFVASLLPDFYKFPEIFGGSD
jgi:hypothetical protein